MIAIVAVCFALVSGCGQKNYERQNDAGPSIQLNEEGPGPMKPPGEGGGTMLPQQMEKPQ